MPEVIWKGPSNALVLQPNAPKFSLGDRIRVTDIYKGLQSLCAASALARGTFGSGFRAGWVVNQCSVETERGGIGTLTIEWEAGGASATMPLPVGNFQLEAQELYPKVERNPYFNGPLGTDADTISAKMVCAVYNCIYLAAQSDGTVQDPTTLINQAAGLTETDGTWSTPTSDQTEQINLGNALLQKLRRGEESYYIAGWRYTYEIFSYGMPAINRGGEIGTPGGPLSGNLPSGTDWLRLADNLEPAGVNGSMYKLTVTWLGGPSGHWDTDLYS